MSKFSYQEYQDVIAKAKAGANSTNNTASAQKVGFFKLKDNEDCAFVRFNIENTYDLQFATIHQLDKSNKWMKISCLAPLGSDETSLCPLCVAAAKNNAIGKAAKKVYVQMLVAYKDPATGEYSAPVPVVWERPAGFSKDIANLLRDYGALKDRVFKITRNGGAGDLKTTYTISYIPMFDNETTVHSDFSVFENFDLSKHSYWVKTEAEIAEFLETGKFPDTYTRTAKKAGVETTDTVKVQPSIPVSQPVVTPVSTVEPQQEVPVQAPVTQKVQLPEVPVVAPTAAEHAKTEQPAERPARVFNKFTF